MADVENALPISTRRELRLSLASNPDPLIQDLPKVDLHLHIEGILTPALKWHFSRRNNMTLTHPRTGVPFATLEEYQDSHDDAMKPSHGGRMSNQEETFSFFEAYYSGFEVLKTKRDYYKLAMHYFERARGMNVRYCELFFDPQGHTRTGTTWGVIMGGFREAQERAEREFNIKSTWIMCFLRDLSPDSAMEHYLAALPYRDMIIGIGLDSNEAERPPLLFQDLFTRARADGFRLTAHCDVGTTYPLEHIRQVALTLGGGGTGADRIDHGLNVVDSLDLMHSIRDKGLGMAICPWSYIRHQPADDVWRRIRVLFDAGVNIAIASDDPAFMEDTWIEENFAVVRRFCGFSDAEVLRLARMAVEVCWAEEGVKRGIVEEIEGVGRRFGVVEG